MKRMQRVFGDLDALMFVDNRLDEDRRAAFLAHLADDPQEAERVALWSRQNDVIRASFASAALEPVPLWLRLGHVAERAGSREPPANSERRPRAEARLIELRQGMRRSDPVPANDSPAVPPRQRRSRSVGLGAAVLLIVGLSVLVIARTLLPQPAAVEDVMREGEDTSALAARAVDAYRTYALDAVRPVELPAAQQAVLDNWLQRRLMLAVRAPDLRAQGWTALGGRLVPGETGPAAYYLYESEPGERLGVYIARNTSAPTGALALDSMEGGGAVLTWGNGQSSYAVTVGRSLDWLSRHAEELKARIVRTAGAD